MPATLHVDDLTVRRGPQLVLDAVTFTVAPGRRVGLVGPNGVGKSTLLGALAGTVELERGSVQLLPPGAGIGWLAQEPERRVDEVVRAYLARRCGVSAATAELDAATAALADTTADEAAAAAVAERYSDALEQWLALGGADHDARAEQVWHELGLAERLLDTPMTALSGGEAARAGLAALLLSRFELYLLDEPTNDLDLDGLDRLERWLRGVPQAVVLVSHDRTFLDRTVTDVVELDEFTHRATWFGGGWQAYRDERELARRHARERYDEYETKRKGLAGRAQREREWATQGLSKAKKKPTDNDKFIKHFKVNQSEQLAGRAARTQKAMERLEVVEQPREPWQLQLSVGSPGRGGDVVAALEGAVVQRGGFRLGPLELEIRAGERVALLGPNGSGKTTLVDLLVGRSEPTEGRRVLGRSVVVGEIDQARRLLAGGGAFQRAFSDASGLGQSETRTLLAKFGLGAEHVTRPLDTFSPGERTRAALALLMATGANCLVLDEPTNHLDLPAIEQLEQALDGFEGTVLLISHDRSVLANVALTRTVRLEAGRIVADEPV
ncbi:MAG: ABC-F family ATP-binding cassette domain-containing protein [Acidimicrobiales bacterium]|nr:ABC-F family ATP-binding cassette domain-containing protein [Acidimicrobiales bacterium]